MGPDDMKTNAHLPHASANRAIAANACQPTRIDPRWAARAGEENGPQPPHWHSPTRNAWTNVANRTSV
eukprot:2883484-Lingulodinium_polyedra.AAC.1